MNHRPPLGAEIAVPSESPQRRRPEFIPSVDFRRWLGNTQLNRLAVVDGVLPASYVSRERDAGRPIREHHGKHRMIDVYARAMSHGHAVTPPRRTQSSAAGERAAIGSWREIAPVGDARSGVVKIANKPHLLLEQEIVAASGAYVRRSGVYFLVSKSRVVYVGQSVDVHSRVAAHRSSGKRFDSAAFIPCEPGAGMDALESAYIHALKPPLNGTVNGKADGAPCAPMSQAQILNFVARTVFNKDLKEAA